MAKNRIGAAWVDPQVAILGPMPEFDQTLQIAISHHQAGQLDLAQAIYLAMLQRDPNDADALHLLGLITLQTGNPARAVELLDRAFAQRPDWADAKSNLAVALNSFGVLLHRERKLDQAICAYNRSIQINPDYAEALSNLCLALSESGIAQEAIAIGRRAIALDLKNSAAYHNLAIALGKKAKSIRQLLYSTSRSRLIRNQRRVISISVIYWCRTRNLMKQSPHSKKPSQGILITPPLTTTWAIH